ncbi:sigma-70 family RNA polymerase sigma factor [Lachnospiraceae bacterium 62-35]
MEPNINEQFQSMYKKYEAPLRKIARNYGIPYDEIDDQIQDTFISYFKNYAVDNEKRGNILVTILKRKCIDYHRSKHYETVSIDTDEGRFAMETFMSEFNKDLVDGLEKEQFYKKVRKCISEMRSEWQEVILYCCIFRNTSEEAGEILGISGTACRSRLLRAREHLKKELGDEFRECYD